MVIGVDLQKYDPDWSLRAWGLGIELNSSSVDPVRPTGAKFSSLRSFQFWFKAKCSIDRIKIARADNTLLISCQGTMNYNLLISV